MIRQRKWRRFGKAIVPLYRFAHCRIDSRVSVHDLTYPMFASFTNSVIKTDQFMVAFCRRLSYTEIGPEDELAKVSFFCFPRRLRE
jgi:hypothetical protein